MTNKINALRTEEVQELLDAWGDPESELEGEARHMVSCLTSAIQEVLKLDTGNNRRLYGIDFEAGMCKAFYLTQAVIVNTLLGDKDESN